MSLLCVTEGGTDAPVESDTDVAADGDGTEATAEEDAETTATTKEETEAGAPATNEEDDAAAGTDGNTGGWVFFNNAELSLSCVLFKECNMFCL